MRIVVRPGMSVRYLAHLYGVTRQAIIDANHLTPPEYKIEIGQTIVVPGASRGARAGARRFRRTTGRSRRAERQLPAGPPRRAKSSRSTSRRPLRGKPPRLPAPSLSPPAARAARKTVAACRRGGKVAAEPAEQTRSRRPSRRRNNGGHYPWPVRGRVLAGYGATKEGGHNAGINIAAARGAPVRAVDAGVVAYAGNEIRGYGNLVLVKHPDGFISAYAHLDSLLVKRGDTVSRGQVIAKVGNTGGVSEPQLHFELRRGKKRGRSARVPGAGRECRRRERRRR